MNNITPEMVARTVLFMFSDMSSQTCTHYAGQIHKQLCHSDMASVSFGGRCFSLSLEDIVENSEKMNWKFEKPVKGIEINYHRKGDTGCVYVATFSNYPELTKIGISINPEQRLKGLARLHGSVQYSCHYRLGNAYMVEQYLHDVLKDYRSKEVEGDGKTEFFHGDFVKTLATGLLQSAESTDMSIDDFLKTLPPTLEGVLNRCDRNAKMAELLDERVRK